MAIGTVNDDVFFFGDTAFASHLTITLVNPYSNETILVDDDYHVSNDTFDGLGGTDTIFFTSFGDAIFIANILQQQIVQNIETFFASNGGDLIQMADETLTMGDLNMFGGNGNDILWGNVGHDHIFGSTGNDNIDGGPGSDSLYGENDNDKMNGGLGDDWLNGGSGNDILYGGFAVDPIVHDKDFSDNVVFPHLMEGVNIVNLVPPGTPAIGIADGNLHVDFQATATLTFREGFAGYNNTLGTYSIAADGTIQTGTILWKNTKTAGLNVAHTIDLPVSAQGGDFGFFIIADGDRKNSGYAGLNALGEGNIHFIYDYGLVTERAATVFDDGTHVKAVYDDGVTEKVLKGYNYFTTERGGDTSLNWDGQGHMVSGIVSIGQHDVLRVGFEDLPNLGDADYEDVFFDLNIDEVIVAGDSEDGNDVLVGGGGDDILYGQDGDDTLVIGEGVDDVYGGNGMDVFVYDFLDGLVDTIHDFEVGAGHDVLNITDILIGYDAMTDLLSSFVQVEALNGDTHVRINADGDVGGAFTAIAILTGVEATLAGLIANGNIVGDQHVPIVFP